MTVDAAVGTVLDSGQVRLEFACCTAELHEMRATYRPGSSPPPAHVHPAQAEHFEVHTGELVFVVDGEERVVGAGEGIDVPPGAVHQVHNPGSVDAEVTWQTRPALRTGEFHCAIAAARDSGDLGRLLAVVEEYADVFVLADQPVHS